MFTSTRNLLILCALYDTEAGTATLRGRPKTSTPSLEILTFLASPHIERLVHDKKPHLVGKVEQVWYDQVNECVDSFES